jgi:hypothetical protein
VAKRFSHPLGFVDDRLQSDHSSKVEGGHVREVENYGRGLSARAELEQDCGEPIFESVRHRKREAPFWLEHNVPEKAICYVKNHLKVVSFHSILRF